MIVLTAILLVVYGLSLLGLAHTYLLYPLQLKRRVKRQPPHTPILPDDAPAEDWPLVSVLMAAYNEEAVIAQKVESLLASDYPRHRIRFFIGSDNSSDATAAIVERYAAQDARIHFRAFTERQGKPSIINQLSEWAFAEWPSSAQHVLVLTDANVLFTPRTVRALVRHFADEALALVDSNIQHIGLAKRGISKTENAYIKGEVGLKHAEGRIWGKTLGPLGGCFALRSTYFSPVPTEYLVDDFYIAMRVFEEGGKAINDLDAVCYEDVSHSIREEIRRKTRIAAGNFQNLQRFRSLWARWPWDTLAYIFWSHKILRWIGPFLILAMAASMGLLAVLHPTNLIYLALLVLQVAFLLLLPAIYFTLHRMGMPIGLLRTITYFNAANWAMLKGFFKYSKGITTNVWQPTKRNVSSSGQH